MSAPVEQLAPEALESQQVTNARVASATAVLALGNIASRVLGLAREFVLSNLFGAGAAVDAFKVATNIPTAFYDLLIGGHVNGAIIPVLSSVTARDGEAALWRLVSVLLSIVTVALSVLVLLVSLLAPQVVSVMGGGQLGGVAAPLAADLLRITAPALIFLSMFAVLSGTLYAVRAFVFPAFAGAVFNGTIVLITLLFSPPLELQPFIVRGLVFFRFVRPPDAITVTAIGWLVGALVQVLLQLPGVWNKPLRLTFNWRHPAVRQIALLYAPVMFSLVMDTLVIRPFSYNLAGGTGEGSIGYMSWATTLIQFPQGLVATAISIAILPTLARQAALIKVPDATLENEVEPARAFKDTLSLGLRLATTLILPAAAGLFILAVPIVALLFEHGAFTPYDTQMTVMALRLYLIGLPFAAIDLLLVYAFYARQDTFTPALIGVVSLIVYMIAAWMLLPTFGLFALMIADSAKHIVHATTSYWLLSRRIGGFGSQRLTITAIKSLMAALALAWVARELLVWLVREVGARGVLIESILLLVSGGVGTLVFFALVWLLRIEEWRWLLGLLWGRIRRR